MPDRHSEHFCFGVLNNATTHCLKPKLIPVERGSVLHIAQVFVGVDFTGFLGLACHDSSRLGLGDD